MEIKINIAGQDTNPTIEINPLAQPCVTQPGLDQDHQHPAKEIIERLKKTRTRSQVAECIWREFGDMFYTEINAGELDDYRNGQFDFWKFYCR